MVLSRVCDFVLKTSVSGACFVASGTWFVVVLEHLAMHAVLDVQYLEELLGRDGLAYLLVVDGVETGHFGIKFRHFHEALFVCLLVVAVRSVFLQLADAHMYLALLVLIFIVDGEEGLCLLLCKVGFLGNVVFYTLAEFLLVEAWTVCLFALLLRHAEDGEEKHQ